MQAPSAQGGLSGEDPAVRPCPSCGAENARSAQFCWMCFRAFAPAPATARHTTPADWPPAPRPAMGVPAPAPAPPVQTRPSAGRLGVVVAVAIAVVASVVLVGLRRGSPSFPDSFAGLHRVDDRQTNAASQAFRSMADDKGLDADMAFYASTSTPTVAVMWVDTSGIADSDAAFQSFLDGFTSGFAGGSIDGQTIVETAAGVTYRCAPIGGQVQAGVCLWDEGDVVWVLVDARTPPSLDASRELAGSVHDAVA